MKLFCVITLQLAVAALSQHHGHDPVRWQYSSAEFSQPSEKFTPGYYPFHTTRYRPAAAAIANTSCVRAPAVSTPFSLCAVCRLWLHVRYILQQQLLDLSDKTCKHDALPNDAPRRA